MRGRRKRDVDGNLELPGIDETIREQLLWALLTDPRIKTNSVSVGVDAGVVVLGGAVASAHAKRAADELVWDTKGVAEVHNQLSVRASGRR